MSNLTPTLKLKRLPHGGALPLPEYATDGSAAMDICSAKEMVIMGGSQELVPTGFAVEVPDGWELQIRPRSGLAMRNGITILNTPATIDSDYRGELKLNLFNVYPDMFYINRGDRVAQIILKPAPHFKVVEVDELSETARGNGGFGSTGI